MLVDGSYIPIAPLNIQLTKILPFESTVVAISGPFCLDRMTSVGSRSTTCSHFSVFGLTWLRDKNAWVTLRVPYPMGAMFTKKVIGRIDDPKGGWKGRGLWANTAHYAPWHIEGGKGTRGKVIKYQVRPDPLSK